MSKKFSLKTGDEFDIRDFIIAEALRSIIRIPETPENFELRFISSIEVFVVLVKARLGSDKLKDVDSEGKGINASIKKLEKATKLLFDEIGSSVKDLDWHEFLTHAKTEAGLSDDEVKKLMSGDDELGE